MNRVRRADFLIVAGITVIAALARAYKLDASLWYDEILTLTDFVRLPLRDIVTQYGSLNNHVFYSLQAHISVAMFGENAVALRLPAMLLGVAAVPVFWIMTRQLSKSVLWAHAAALLLALSYHHIWFSQNARGYTGLFFWCLLATFLFISGARSGRFRTWAAFSVVLAAAMYTHLSAAFFVLSIGLVYAAVFAAPLVGRKAVSWPGLRGLQPLAAFIAAGALCLVLFAPMLPQMVEVFTAVSAPDPTEVKAWRNPFWTVLEVLRSLPVPLALTLAALPAVLLVLGFGFVDIWKREALIPALFVTHIVVTFATLIGLGMRIWPRYFLFDLVFFLLFAVAGVFSLGALAQRWLRKDRAGGDLGRNLGILGCLAGILVSTVMAGRNYTAPKQDLQGAVAFIENRRAADDVAVSIGLARLPISSYFAPDWPTIETKAELDVLRQTAGAVWLIYAFPAHTKRKFPEILAVVESEFERVAKLTGTMGGGEVLVYRSR